MTKFLKFLSLVLILGMFSCKSVQQPVKNHDYVDLGLPSGTLWATTNIGASKPIEPGTYLNFGYNFIPGRTQYNGGTLWDGITGSQYDQATAHWGKEWRTPTKSEIEELVDKCDWEAIKDPNQNNNTVGFKVKGPNGNIIVLPAGGMNGVYKDGKLVKLSEIYKLCLWSATPYYCVKIPYDPHQPSVRSFLWTSLSPGTTFPNVPIRPVRNK